MGEDQVNGVVTEENGAAETEAAPEQTQPVPEASEASEAPENGQVELEAAPEPEQTQAVPETSEAPENGQAEAAPEQESVANETEKPEEQNKNIKTVANILHRVKEDTEMSSDQKIDTLSMLLTKFVAENGV